VHETSKGMPLKFFTGFSAIACNSKANIFTDRLIRHICT